MDKEYVENDVFVFRLGLPWELANLEIPIYTNPAPQPWHKDYDPGNDFTLDEIEDMVKKSYFTPERIKELKNELIKKIEESENPFVSISCADYDGGYNVTEDELFHVDWKKL